MVPMTHRKFISIVLILFFGLSLSASGALGRVACDREQCKHDAMKGIANHKADMNFEPMSCCAETQNDPCELERGQPRIVQDGAVSMARVYQDGPSVVLVIGSNVLSDNLTQRVFGPHPNDGTHFPSSPIYLRNVTLIC